MASVLPTDEEKSVLILMTEKGYDKNLPAILRHLLEKHEKICFVSSCMTWEMFTALSRATGLNISQIVFIDTLSSYYTKRDDIENCLFIDSPLELDGIRGAIRRAVSSKSCRALLLDSVSDFWSQEYVMKLLGLLNSFSIEKDFEDKTKWLCFIEQVLPQDYNERIKDFSMLAEKVIILNNS